jgi:raffinose/stachyose/melibiose transport system permease protein
MFRYTKRTALLEILVILAAIVLMTPFYLLIVTALKPPTELLNTSPMVLSPNSTLNGFATVFAQTGRSSVWGGLMYSGLTTAATILGVVVIGSVTGYVLARKIGRLSTIMFVLVIAGIMVPAQLGMIPIYVAFRTLGLLGHWYGLSILYIGALTPLAVFLYTGFARGLDSAYEEAALVDGATKFQIFYKVVFPLLMPVTGTVAILVGLIAWNDFFMPLIFLSGSKEATLPVVIYQNVGGLTNRWDLIFSLIIVSMVPILAFYLVAQKKFIQGFSGGLKG